MCIPFFDSVAGGADCEWVFIAFTVYGNTSLSAISLSHAEQRMYETCLSYVFFKVLIVPKVSLILRSRKLPLFWYQKPFNMFLTMFALLKNNSLVTCRWRFYQPINRNYFETAKTYPFSVSVQFLSIVKTISVAISEYDLLFYTKEELLVNLSDENAIDIKRIPISRNDNICPT